MYKFLIILSYILFAYQLIKRVDEVVFALQKNL